MSENDKPVFSIEKLYVKDLSLEVPGAPGVFKEKKGAPQIEITMNNTAQALEDGFYEVLVKATVTAKIEDTTLFLVEASQGGVFQIRNLTGDSLEMTLGIAAPNIIFPYLRETISEAVSKAGFPPVLLQPMNFEAVYRARKQEQEQATPESSEATKH
ncbi:MAG: protein-export chaperone SecB [Proteobacteria bacterium]|nr:protein-export chaperone SecB [Pseudomonadota bacterium]